MGTHEQDNDGSLATNTDLASTVDTPAIAVDDKSITLDEDKAEPGPEPDPEPGPDEDKAEPDPEPGPEDGQDDGQVTVELIHHLTVDGTNHRPGETIRLSAREADGLIGDRFARPAG